MPIGSYYGGHGSKVMKEMKERYGGKHGEEVFYATANKRGQKPGKDDFLNPLDTLLELANTLGRPQQSYGAADTPSKEFKVGGRIFTDYDSAASHASRTGEEVMVRDEKTRQWREVANSETHEDDAALTPVGTKITDTTNPQGHGFLGNSPAPPGADLWRLLGDPPGQWRSPESLNEYLRSGKTKDSRTRGHAMLDNFLDHVYATGDARRK
jgi:hypothetical protein